VLAAPPAWVGRGLGAALALAGASLPLAVLLARAARPLLGVVPGGFPGLTHLFLLAALLPALPGLGLGWTFAAAWAGASRPLDVYLAEAAGAALAGLAFTFVLLPGLGLLAAVLLAGAVSSLGGLWADRSRIPRLAAGLGLALCLAGLAALPRLESVSAAWRFGPDVVAVEDTPYQTLALTRQDGQYTLFADGGWRFTTPDPESAQWAAHPALLSHPRPRRVLLLGGDPCGSAGEALLHPSVEALDVVDADPAVPLLLRRAMPAGLCPALAGPRAQVHAEDAAAFLRRPEEPYDVALLGLGEPVGLGQARFVSLEFFAALRQRLGPDGVLSLALPGNPAALGPAQARVLAGVRATLAAVFPEILVLPGASVRFLAATRPGLLPDGPEPLLRRMEERGLAPAYIRPDSLADAFNPWPRATLDAVLDAAGGTVNRQFSPAAHLAALRAWLFQLAPGWVLPAAPAGAGLGFWVGLAALSGLLGWWLARGGSGRAAARCVTGCVALAGGANMVLSLALLLGIQVLAGTLASRLALLSAGVMAGLALGAARVQAAGWRGRPALTRLAWAQAGLVLALAGTGPLLLLLAGPAGGLPGPVRDAVFAGLACGVGLLGGLHFSLAVRVLGADSGADPGRGGRLYALDLAGAALFLLPATLVGFPLLGFTGTLLAAAIPGLAGLSALAVVWRKGNNTTM
jgi:spermidine synthase